MGETEEREEIRDFAPHSLDGQEHTPRDQSKVDLLSPPEPARLLGNNLEGILVDWRVRQPSDPVDCEFSGIRVCAVCEICGAVPRDIIKDADEMRVSSRVTLIMKFQERQTWVKSQANNLLHRPRPGMRAECKCRRSRSRCRDSAAPTRKTGAQVSSACPAAASHPGREKETCTSERGCARR